ncbi:MAG: Peptidyl-prolyl cis-trans isomerase B [Desulfovibrio sp.]
MSDNPKILIETSMGDITVELYPEKAPKTVKNFLEAVRNKHYDDTVFHRVIKGFMVQGGGMNAEMKEKAWKKQPIKNEAATGVSNERGAIAMARTGDPHSATVQFFINTVDNEHLNHSSPTPAGYGYCAFGKVTEGMDVVDAIEDVATTSKGFHDDVPEESVIIKSIRKA